MIYSLKIIKKTSKKQLNNYCDTIKKPFTVGRPNFTPCPYRTVFRLKRLNREPNRLKRNFMLIFYYKPLIVPSEGFDRFS